MERSKAQLLELARCGLWGSELNITLFEDGVNWDEIFQLAKDQTLWGVISVAIETLPLSLRPERKLILLIHQMVSLNRQYYKHYIKALAKILTLLKQAGIERPVLLKGLGVGINYPDPSLRQCGDIDIYVGEEHYLKAWTFICKELEVKKESHAGHHFEIKLMGVDIEIHRCAISANDVEFNGREFMAWAKSQLEGDDLRKVSIEGVEVYLPPYNFDFIYIFYHAFKHFLAEGVGLRHFCDWGCYVDSLSENIDKEEARRLIKLFKLEKTISLFATVAVKALGVKAEKFPYYVEFNDSQYQRTLNLVWDKGNFGVCDIDMKRASKPFLIRKIWGATVVFRNICYWIPIDYRYALNLIRSIPKRAFREVHKRKIEFEE